MTTPAPFFLKATRSWRLLLALLIAGAATLASAQERPRRPQPAQQSEQRQGGEQAPAEQRAADARGGVLRLLPPDSVTEHSVDIPGGKLAYTATAGTLTLFDQSGERAAAIYYTAYVARGAEGASRPITFAFNGGPGAASAYLNLGLVGPRILEFTGNDPAAARLQDNPNTWLAFTDLVLIDPVGTGWSRAAKPTAPTRSTACVRMPRRWRKPSRSTLPRTVAAMRPNTSSAKATAGSAPPWWRRRCSASRASRSPASSWSRR
jgi:carboxypeptidase C (cathepsin A)